ncbi:hypothetical protein AtEden1_Chr4g0285901 [Arabidopsis thaliana]
MELEGVSLPLIHKHLMMPWNDLKRGDCCGRSGFTTGGYYCKRCDFYVHKKCVDECLEYIEHPSHTVHALKLQSKPDYDRCRLCCMWIENLCYCCKICDFYVDLFCVKYPPPDVIDISETHDHKLTHIKKWTEFNCIAKCGKKFYEFPYKCLESYI